MVIHPKKKTEMETEQTFELIDKLSFFDGFSKEEKKYLTTLKSQILKYLPSDTLITEGELDYSFFILLKGVVRIVKSYPKEMPITKLKAGAVFGEIAFVAHRTRTTSVIADGDVVALKIDTRNMDALKPAIIIKLKDKMIQILVTRLEAMNEKAAQSI
jgi:CRP-like cAMP-binding protein